MRMSALKRAHGANAGGPGSVCGGWSVTFSVLGCAMRDLPAVLPMILTSGCGQMIMIVEPSSQTSVWVGVAFLKSLHRF